jgi:hypothetical protein
MRASEHNAAVQAVPREAVQSCHSREGVKEGSRLLCFNSALDCSLD